MPPILTEEPPNNESDEVQEMEEIEDNADEQDFEANNIEFEEAQGKLKIQIT